MTKFFKSIYSKLCLLCALLICSCNSSKAISYTGGLSDFEGDFFNWEYKDVEKDSIPGISLNRGIELLKNIKCKPVVVAVLDMPVQTSHPDLSDYMWENPGEIDNNGIDDDLNGYIDDRYGWNFLGTSTGNQVSFTNYEFIRVIREYEKDSIKGISGCINLEDYRLAVEAYKKRLEYAQDEYDNKKMVYDSNKNVSSILNSYFPDHNINLDGLDSLKVLYPDNQELQNAILIKSNFIKYDFTPDNILKELSFAESRLKRLLNTDYDDRHIIGDTMNISNYGNAKINLNTSLLDHGTIVSGVIAKFFENISNLKNQPNIKIMPLVISGYGDEHDNDIANAIIYAVDNGAEVINISSSKSFSLNSDKVEKALIYAEHNNVLIVTSAGNDNTDLDRIQNFPNDTDDLDEEVVVNFIKVGSSTPLIKGGLKAPDSNYGSREVDLFAPGYMIYSADVTAVNDYHSGTSVSAPLVAGIAALLYAYFPEMKVSEIKKILLNSGITFDQNTNSKERFPDFSKTGKVINVYNALLAAKNFK